MHPPATTGREPRRAEPTRTQPPISERPTGLLGALVRIPTFEALQYREFRLLWLGQGGTGMASWMDQVARGWLMYQLTDSALQLGLVRAAQAVPFLLLSPIAGTVADRYDRKAQLLVAQVVDALLYGLMATLILTGLVQPWHVYATGLGTAIVQVFQQPARQAMLSESVGPRHLTNAIGLNSMAFNLSRTTGPAVAGALIALVDTGGSYVAQALLYLVSTLWTAQLRPPARLASGPRGHGGHPSFVASMVEGWQFIARSETVRTGMLVAALAGLLAMPFATFLPIFARDILQAGPTGQGLLLTGMGVGALCSAVLIASFGDGLPKGLLMVGGLGLYGLAVVGFSASSWFALSVFFMLVAGLCNVACNALVQTVVQANAPSQLRGRMMGVFQQSQVLTTVGSLVAGALTSIWDAPWTIGSMGFLCFLSAGAIFLAIPAARFIR